MGPLTFNVRREKMSPPDKAWRLIAPLGHALIANPRAGDESRLEPAVSADAGDDRCRDYRVTERQLAFCGWGYEGSGLATNENKWVGPDLSWRSLQKRTSPIWSSFASPDSDRPNA
jgi:hypothetical protein